MSSDLWPALPLDEWLPTYETLRRWTQVVGKTRLQLAPFENHWWNCTLYVTARGVTTSPMPTRAGNIDVELDFLSDSIVARASWGQVETMRLESKSVASFYDEWTSMLRSFGVEVRIVAKPNEVADATPFPEDRFHATYDSSSARSWWTALSSIDRVLKQFKGRFNGKCSPSHFWWGGFDLACTRFSGRRAPPHPGGIANCPDFVMLEAYSHECISAGWWPGTPDSPVAYPAVYAYAYPEPDGCSAAPIEPAEAHYHPQMREWILPYDAVRVADDPDAMVLSFLESTYMAAASLGGWAIEALHASPPIVAPRP
jgi:hypothetical protein